MLSAAKHLAAARDRPVAEFPLSAANGLKMTGCDSSHGQGFFFTIEPCLSLHKLSARLTLIIFLIAFPIQEDKMGNSPLQPHEPGNDRSKVLHSSCIDLKVGASAARTLSKGMSIRRCKTQSSLWTARPS